MAAAGSAATGTSAGAGTGASAPAAVVSAGAAGMLGVVLVPRPDVVGVRASVSVYMIAVSGQEAPPTDFSVGGMFFLDIPKTR